MCTVCVHRSLVYVKVRGQILAIGFYSVMWFQGIELISPDLVLMSLLAEPSYQPSPGTSDVSNRLPVPQVFERRIVIMGSFIKDTYHTHTLTL